MKLKGDYPPSYISSTSSAYDNTSYTYQFTETPSREFTININGSLEKHFIFTDINTEQEYFITSTENSTKLFDFKGQPILKLKEDGFGILKSKYIITYLVNDPRYYAKIQVKTKSILGCKYKIITTRKNGIVNEYEWKDKKTLSDKLILSHKGTNTILLEYSPCLTKDDKLKMFGVIPEEDFKIFLITLCQIIYEDEEILEYIDAAKELAS